ncbi:MAG: GNAT family N-acetyltransferase [Desulfobacteraceae bacterium]|nr:GNAT family N-acetyltransferase [Desulfobacteraceae bacterium]
MENMNLPTEAPDMDLSRRRPRENPPGTFSLVIGKRVAPELWDRYVRKEPGAEFTHLSGWGRVIREVYGHRPVYLAATETSRGGDVVRGILPLVRFRSMAGGGRLVSLPFFDTAGILGQSRPVEAMLLKRAVALVKARGCAGLEIRQDFPLSCSTALPGLGMKVATHKVGLKLLLEPSPQRMMKRFRSKLRSQINKAVKNGLRARIGKAELIDPFYEVFSRNMRDLGSPVHSRRFFGAVMERFREHAFICVVTHGRQPVAAGFMFRFKDEMKNPWASSVRAFRPMNANMLLYWAMIRFSCNLKLSRFDMGRSTRNASTFRFKKQWRPEERQLYWFQWSPGKKGLPTESLSFRPWTGLPLAMANGLGPLVRRHISL